MYVCVYVYPSSALELSSHRKLLVGFDICFAGGKETQVGLVHNVFWTEPQGKGLLYTHVK